MIFLSLKEMLSRSLVVVVILVLLIFINDNFSFRGNWLFVVLFFNLVMRVLLLVNVRVWLVEKIICIFGG